MIDEMQLKDSLMRAWLMSWIENHEKPNWYRWFGFYPAKSSVDAAKSQLKLMDEGLILDFRDNLEIFNE